MDNVVTKVFNESFEGILICGINWGGTNIDSDVNQKDPETYFSDLTAYDWTFRNRLLKWFSLWGHELKGHPSEIGNFEKSIIYTNWLNSKTPSKENIFQSCKEDHQTIFAIIEFFRPKLIFFLSKELLQAFNSSECIDRANEILGNHMEPMFIQRDIVIRNKKLRKFFLGFQDFERSKIIALPHPTGSIDLSDEYIASFKDEIGGAIAEWKAMNMS